MPEKYALLTGVKNKILRSQSQPVKKITKATKEFCGILMEKLYEYDGVGLAAPQIGELQRIIAVTYWKEEGENGENISQTGEEVMINPVIISKSKEKFIFDEACLSVPGQNGDVFRHRTIKVQYQTADGKTHTKKLSNMNAVIVQHEIDHLDGVLFVDKLAAQ